MAKFGFSEGETEIIKDFLCVHLLFLSVLSGMKEAQEKLTGDAFKQGHTGDEL